jgi:hypothetical protein
MKTDQVPPRRSKIIFRAPLTQNSYRAASSRRIRDGREEQTPVKIESGQVAVITGEASGIGYGLAQRLGARGMRLVLADIRRRRSATLATRCSPCAPT